MENDNSCPFYGRDEDWCDVGFGYVSPHDVEVIVRHCVSRYADCPRFGELQARHGRNGSECSAPAVSGIGRRVQPADDCALPVIPASVDRETLTEIHHELRTPLTSIRSFTEILLQYPVENLDAKRQFLRLIYEESQRLTRTVDALFGTAEAAAKLTARPAQEDPMGTSGHPGNH